MNPSLHVPPRPQLHAVQYVPYVPLAHDVQYVPLGESGEGHVSTHVDVLRTR